MKRRLEAVEMLFYTRMLKMTWTERLTQRGILMKNRNKKTFIHTIRKGKLTFLGYIMRKESLKKIDTVIDGKRNREKHLPNVLV